MDDIKASKYAISISMFLLASLLYFPLRQLEEANELYLAAGLFIVIMCLFFVSIFLFTSTFMENNMVNNMVNILYSILKEILNMLYNILKERETWILGTLMFIGLIIGISIGNIVDYKPDFFATIILAVILYFCVIGMLSFIKLHDRSIMELRQLKD